MDATTFTTKIKQYPFTKEGIVKIKDKSARGEDCVVVHFLFDDKEAYVSETQSAYDRMNQHYANSKHQKLTTISLILSDTFNKSTILDVENMLITHMHTDDKYILQNSNGGQSKLHNYYQKSLYRGLFENLWNKLQTKNLVKNSLFEVENSERFKFSQYKELTGEQYND